MEYHDNIYQESEKVERKGSSTVVLLGTAGGSPESPCPGTAVPGWHCIGRPPVRRSRRKGGRKEGGRRVGETRQGRMI